MSGIRAVRPEPTDAEALKMVEWLVMASEEEVSETYALKLRQAADILSVKTHGCARAKTELAFAEEGNLAAVHFNGQTWRPEPQWQDISTAPKDRPIFLWGYLECSALSRPHVGCDDRYEAVWHAEFKAWQAVGYGGWIVQPTHWHPTPEPPVGSGQNLADANSKSPIQAREE